MINKSENTASNIVASANVPSSSANVQNMMGSLVSVSNTSDASIETLPLEMIYHIGSFLNLKEKISFHQALIDAGIISLDEREFLQEFRDSFLTQKINILLGMQYYDFSKFYISNAQNEEVENLYSFLFSEMCEDFQKRKALSEEIVALVESIEANAFVKVPNYDNTYEVEVIDPDFLDGDRIQAYVDRVDSNEPKNTKELVDYLFPDLTNLDIRKEIEERVEEFDTRKGQRDRRMWRLEPLEILKNLLKFLKMEEQYRGMPIKLAARTQKLANSHLRPIIQKISEKMQALPTEALRAWVIMATDKEQREDFCAKMIEVGAKDNPFYAKGSPYYHMLKHDLLHRIKLLPASDALPYNRQNKRAYIHYIAYYADDEYLRLYTANLMTKFLEIQVKNGEDPVSESRPKTLFPFLSAYYLDIRNFFNSMEEQHRIAEYLKQAHKSRLSLVKEFTPDSCTLAVNSPEHMLSAFIRNEHTFSSLMGVLKVNPHYINAQDVNGDTLLHLAVKISSDMVGIVADFNGDPNIKNGQGFTPLILVTQLENMQLMSRMLTLQNLDVNKRDDSGNTALHHAILANKKMAMHRLLRHSAIDKTVVNAEGNTPRDLAESVGLLSLYDILSQA